jgi:hypothetical protein
MVFTEDHGGHKDRIPRTYINDLSVFATFVAFLLVLGSFAFVVSCWTIRTDPASMRLHVLPERHG